MQEAGRLPRETKPVLVSGFPRRGRIECLTAEELAIRNIIIAVEKLGASTHLTECVMLLDQARGKLADHIEGR